MKNYFEGLNITPSTGTAVKGDYDEALKDIEAVKKEVQNPELLSLISEFEQQVQAHNSKLEEARK